LEIVFASYPAADGLTVAADGGVDADAGGGGIAGEDDLQRILRATRRLPLVMLRGRAHAHVERQAVRRRGRETVAQGQPQRVGTAGVGITTGSDVREKKQDPTQTHGQTLPQRIAAHASHE
jgi:hypothetical protein